MATVTVTSSDNGVASQQLVDVVQLAVSQLNQAEGDALHTGETPAKRQRTDDTEISSEQSIKQILFNINKAICLRLDSIENKLEMVSVRTKYLEEKVEQMINKNLVLGTSFKQGHGRRSSAVIVGLPQNRSGNILEQCSPPHYSFGILNSQHDADSDSNLSGFDQSFQNLGPNVQLITLNTEEDFPNGCWLGDETNPEMRVRVPITPSDLLHIHSNCRTPEKMALTLLDYLFDRDTQAMSNLSGMGKHGKNQLDPLIVYGIRCHLIYRFGIAEADWHRIKQNIDSKCRTAFRRKVRGLPLTVKAFRGKAPPTYIHMQANEHQNISLEMASDDSLNDDSELHIEHQGEIDISQAAGVMQQATAAEIIQSAGGEIQVLHATPEQVAQLQQAHQIQILQGDAAQVMLQQAGVEDSIQVAVSMATTPDGTLQVINTDSGETLHIAPSDEIVSEVDGVDQVQVETE